MTNPLVLTYRSITGRMYATIGILSIALVATNILTIIYSDTVSAGARTVLQKSINGVEAADEFDELLDQHRRIVTAQTAGHAADEAETEISLTRLEQRLSDLPATARAARVLSVELAGKLAADVAQLGDLARATLNAVGATQDHREAAAAPEAFIAYTN
jgi:hypothetical protein